MLVLILSFTSRDRSLTIRIDKKYILMCVYFFFLRNLSGSYLGESPRSTTNSPAREALVLTELLITHTIVYVGNVGSIITT